MICIVRHDNITHKGRSALKAARVASAAGPRLLELRRRGMQACRDTNRRGDMLF